MMRAACAGQRELRDRLRQFGLKSGKSEKWAKGGVLSPYEGILGPFFKAGEYEVSRTRRTRLLHGIAFDQYIKRVIKSRHEIKTWLQQLIGEFVDTVVHPADEPAVHHLASCLGLIRAAGIIGVRFGTLPYSEKLVDRCIVRCYRAARRALRTESELLRSGLRRLRAQLKSSNMPKVGRKRQLRALVFKMADGYKDESGSTPTVTIRAEKFKGWFDDQRQPALVLRWLQSKKALPYKPALPANSGNAIVWAESQTEWPDGSRPRSIVIQLAKGLLDQLKV
jgi:hypothetical protein